MQGGHEPKSNTEFWNEKCSRNVARDERVKCQLEERWRVVVAWECDTGSSRKAEEAAKRIAGLLRHSPATGKGLSDQG